MCIRDSPYSCVMHASIQASPAALEAPTTELLGGELVRLVKLLVAMRAHAPSPHPAVDQSHFPVLFALATGPQRISDLAGCAHADVSTVSRQVTHLVQHGLLTKLADPDDRRAHLVSLTDVGQAAIERIVAARGQWLAAIMSDWTDSQAQDFLQHLRRFTESLEVAKASFERTVR